jgi:hypothetical protein
MPTWSGILAEIHEAQRQGNRAPQDAVRRRYLDQLRTHTGRPVILYASKWTQQAPNVSPEVVSIVDEDLQGIMEVVHGMAGPNLDLILHSPGGSAEAAEALVTYLRSKFSHIRVVVPHLAMSAATIVACFADSIVMGKHSFLGPIDPQMIIITPLGQRMVPAEAIREQFERAKRECRDPSLLAAWLPMLNQYGPDLLVQCENALEMARALVRKGLSSYMFASLPDRRQRAANLARWLASHRYFKSHGRHIPRTVLEERGFRIERLEDDQQLQDLVLSVFHATTHTFDQTGAVKIIENHLGKAFIKQVQLAPILVSAPTRPAGPAAPPPAQEVNT